MSLKKNVIANYLGQAWAALMGLVFVPVYIRYLGVEAWGLVGFMSMLQGWFTLLDTFTLYTRYRYNFKPGDTNSNFHEINLGLYTRFFSLYL